MPLARSEIVECSIAMPTFETFQTMLSLMQIKVGIRLKAISTKKASVQHMCANNVIMKALSRGIRIFTNVASIFRLMVYESMPVKVALTAKVHVRDSIPMA